MEAKKNAIAMMESLMSREALQKANELYEADKREIERNCANFSAQHTAESAFLPPKAKSAFSVSRV